MLGARLASRLLVGMPVKKGKWAHLALWALVIFITSCFYVPSKAFVRTVGGKLQIINAASTSGFDEFWRHWWWLFVKDYHVLEFTLLTALLFRAIRTKLTKSPALTWSGLIAFGYSCSDEYHQAFVPGRGGKWTDVAID